MNEKARVVEAGIGHAVVALIEERDAEWARATDAETLERLAAQRLAEVEAERDALQAENERLDEQIQRWIRSATEAKDETRAVAAHRDALQARLNAVREALTKDRVIMVTRRNGYTVENYSNPLVPVKTIEALVGPWTVVPEGEQR